MTNFNIISSFVSRARSSARLDPARDWIIMLIISLIVLTGVVIWNAWAFDTVAGGGTIGLATTSLVPTFNQSSLDAIRTVFANRAAEEEKYVTGVYRFSDPSQ